MNIAVMFHGLPGLNMPVVTLQEFLLGCLQEVKEPQASEDTFLAKICQPYHHLASPHGILQSDRSDNPADG